jgi:NADH:ubiquinone oxidoreductase subunit 4 (subunit M)
MLRLYQDIMNGPPVEDVPVRADLSWAEALAVAPLLAALIVIGVFPAPLLASSDTVASAQSARVP